MTAKLLRMVKVTVITTCSARKAQPVPQSLRARTLSRGSVSDIARQWKARVESGERHVTASQLYQGRGFREAVRTARYAEGDLYIVSAGLGLVSEHDALPPYSLTVADQHADAVTRRLKNVERFHPKQWWAALYEVGIAKTRLHEQIRRATGTIFVLALSPNYLRLVEDDLRKLGPKDIQRLRIIGPRRARDIPEFLHEALIPYDARLDGPDSPIRGTESDFPQRAARHFVEEVQMRTRLHSLDEHKREVQSLLRPWRTKVALSRRRLPENKLRAEIRKALKETGGRWTAALRKLRDHRNIACEQKRFQKICSELSA
jgi:uncharacterized protein DUF6884